MILIVGGCYQGKAALARQLADCPQEIWEGRLQDGETAPLDAAGAAPFVLNFHGFLRRMTDPLESAVPFAESVLQKNPRVVTLDEVGCGIVPIDRADRDYREAVGLAGQVLAAGASAVYRVSCGLALKIK